VLVAAAALLVAAASAQGATAPSPRHSDLGVAAVTGPGAASRGDRIVVEVTTENHPGPRAQLSVTGFTLSRDGKASAGDVELRGVRRVGKLRGGASDRGEAALNLPAGMGTGRWFLIACADAGDRVHERHEKNNCARAPGRLKVGDLGDSPAALAWTPSQWSFGTIEDGMSESKTFTLTNTGGQTSPRIFDVQTSDHDLSLSHDTCIAAFLSPGESCQVEVTASPRGARTVNATLVATAEPGGLTPTAHLSFTGVQPPPPPPQAKLVGPGGQFYFGPVQVGKQSEQFPYPVTNFGTETSSPISVTLTGANASAFKIVSDTCAGVQLPPEEGDCVVTVVLAPHTNGNKKATLSVSATNGGTTAITLLGSGGNS
jgi:hypothetical protein